MNNTMQMSLASSLVPRSVTEIIQQTFNIYQANFSKLIVISAMVLIPLTIIDVALSELLLDNLTNETTQNVNSLEDIEVDALFNLVGISLISSLIILLAQQVLLNGTITYLSSEFTLGKEITPQEALNGSSGRLIELAKAMGLGFLMIVALSFVLGLAFLLCGLGVGIIIYAGVCLFSLLPPVMVLENVSYSQGLSRAWGLAKARFWPVFWLVLAMSLISFFSAFFVVFILSAIGLISGNSGDLSNVIVSLVISILLAPVMPIGMTLMYYDTRIRLESIDITLESLSDERGNYDARPADLPSPALPTRPDGNDFSTIVVLSIGTVVAGIFFSMLFSL